VKNRENWKRQRRKKKKRMSRDGRKREGSKREKNGKRRAVKDGYIGMNVMKAEDAERKSESADPKKFLPFA